MERKIRKIRMKIKSWLHFHNPKMLFCNHKYVQCGTSCDEYETYTHYRCRRCGKNMTIQDGRICNTCKD